MLNGTRNETLKTLAISAGLIAAIAASGAFLVARAAPAPVLAKTPGAATFASEASKSKTATFAASCGQDMSVDMRPDPEWVGQSFAKDDCWAPALPAFINGYSADNKKVEASMAAMEKYIAQAHVYQRCIASFVVAKRAEADRTNVPLDKAFLVIEDHRIAASKANEKKVSTQVEITIAQFNQNGSDCTDGGDIVFGPGGETVGDVSDAGNDLSVPG
ncbi:MAG TPA: hypothetical protein VG798_02185 [Rhizomicrobium sp.]|nr:hypothetical protein [Rhizomicrobium sp.]